MTYVQLSVQEREIIQKGLWERKSIRSIARTLDRSPSSVMREINKNVPQRRCRYTPRLAHERALKNRSSRGRTLRLKNDTIHTYVVIHLKLRWSPEQIAGRMKKDDIGSISPEAIYQFIYTQIKNNKPKKGCEDLRPYLRRRQPRRAPHGARRYQRTTKPLGTSIDERPVIIEHRARLGDWEGDTVESRDHRPGINTLLERKSGIVLITKLHGRKSTDTTHALATRFATIPSSLKYSLTLDNGTENSDWRSIEQQTGLKTYYAHPYHSWERGSNENVNGLIRDYFPKKTDFTLVSDAELSLVEYDLNTRPRKRHDWRTPLEVVGVAVGG